MADFYTYIYHDNDTPIYVGKGMGWRCNAHLKNARNPFLKNKLTKMKREGREPRIQIIDAPDEAAAFEMEELLIALIGRRDLGLGPLLNLTDGGEGTSNPSLQTRALRSEAAKNATPETRFKWGSGSRGKKRINSPETRVKMSVSKSKACTVDGITIYPSHKALCTALGYGNAGHSHPNFRYV